MKKLLRKLKRLFRKNSRNDSYYYYNNYKSKYAYYDRKNFIDNIYKLIEILNPKFSDTTKHIKSSLAITPYSLVFGSNSKLIVRQLGTPAFIHDNTNYVQGHYTYFYKKKIGNYKLLIQLHFLNDILFFVCTEIYANNDLTRRDKHKIVQLIFQKYGTPEVEEDGNILVKLEDNNGNIMFTRDESEFFICYLSNNSDIKELASTLKWKQEKIREEKEKIINKRLMKNL